MLLLMSTSLLTLPYFPNSLFPVEGNRRKPTTFARALTESFYMSVSVRTNCATEAPVVHTRVEEGGRGGGGMGDFSNVGQTSCYACNAPYGKSPTVPHL